MLCHTIMQWITVRDRVHPDSYYNTLGPKVVQKATCGPNRSHDRIAQVSFPSQGVNSLIVLQATILTWHDWGHIREMPPELVDPCCLKSFGKVTSFSSGAHLYASVCIFSSHSFQHASQVRVCMMTGGPPFLSQLEGQF